MRDAAETLRRQALVSHGCVHRRRYRRNGLDRNNIGVDVVRSRRELRRRWDADGLDAIEHFVETANRAVSALFDGGRSKGRDDPEES